MMARVEKTIRERNLIAPGMHVLAGVSGGVDSVVLLYVLWCLQKRIAFRLSAVHVHHGLRGREADRDAAWVKTLCERLAIRLHMNRGNVKDEQARSGSSMEMAARTVRLDAFNAIAEKIGAHVVAVAHHRDDQAETILMRLLTGSGIDGLGGMDYTSQPRQGLTIIRPLLDVSREEIETYAARVRLTWREDRSNRDPAMLRNRIRFRIMPMLIKEGFVASVASLTRFGELMREEQKLLEWRTGQLQRRCMSGTRIRLKALSRLSIADARRVLRSWLNANIPHSRANDFEQIERLRSMLHASTSGQMMISGAQVIRWSDGRCWMEENARAGTVVIKPITLKMPGVTVIPESGLTVTVTASRGFSRARQTIGKYPMVVHIRREKKTGRITVRSRREGDIIAPTGMAGRVSVKELLINQKVPAAARGMVPLLVAAGGDVVCLAGFRVSRNWAVPSSTSSSWKITFTQ